MAKRDLNADWRAYYQTHLVSIEEAAKEIFPGDVIYLGQATMIPYEFLEYLYQHKEDYRDVTFWYNVMNMPNEMIFDHDSRAHFRLLNIFNLPLDRMALELHTIEPLGAGYDTYADCMWEYGVNASATQVCPPNADGWCNVGCYGVTTNSVTNPDPRIVKKFGFIDATGVFPAPGPDNQNGIHITEFDYIIENNTEMMPLPVSEPTPLDVKTASYILPYIKDGDKVQIGYGGLGEEILRNLKDLPGSFEVFSEVLCDSMMPLVESGKITKIRASSPGACTVECFKWLATTEHDVRLYPRTICIEPLSTMMQENIVAINATFMVDLLGQACSEAQGLKPYTGMGGSFAYIYGSQRAKGGRSFLCLRSTYIDKNGETRSNVVPWLPEGSIVSMLKNYVMFVVSEWGVADIYLKSYPDRIKALIKIAHPDFRSCLREQILTTPLIEEWDFRDYDMFDNVIPEPRQPNTATPSLDYPIKADPKI
ncbi:MAG: acetyl-CoA hydrolase/transferase C-terminal domain-containing protein [Oscillospiraceae bacterium]|nr:acetyl-CoA hydrolase/transferase C-terminal domain-containing protein [Oscillospiraceae bacterium]